MSAIPRRHFLKSSVAATLLLYLGAAPRMVAEVPVPRFKFEPEKSLIPAPKDPALWPEFRDQLLTWREAKRRELNYSDELYRRKDFSWVASSFCCCFLMLGDETFYSPTSGRYRVREFIDHGRREFGGYDSVVLWHAYPRIGLDERNQFDFYREMPGGLKGLRRAVDELHAAKVRVYIDYNPWDMETRREARSDIDALVEMVAALDVDGIFLDTMDRGAEAFRAKLDAVRKGVVLEGEVALPLERVHDHHMGWAQWFGDSEAPGVLRNKWFERRHMQHQIDRWNRDHSTELHQAWMNGSGMMVWENVFGAWVGWNKRDRAILRSMLPIQRRYANLFSGERWTPLVSTLHPNVYASLWEADGLRLWTLVNRANEPVQGELLRIRPGDGERVYDVIAGREAQVKRLTNEVGVSASIPPRGIGCFVSGSNDALGKHFASFLKAQRNLQIQAKWNTDFPEIRTTLKAVARTSKHTSVPVGMVAIPAVSRTFKVEFRSRECAYYESTHPSKQGHGNPDLHKPIWFERPATLQPYAMDLTPVTNAAFAAFLKVSGYRPRHELNFLKHWLHGAPPSGKEDHPVVYVDLEDARAYAKWAGKRLPSEEEWQYAAQGDDARKYPWGGEMSPRRCNAGETRDTTPVTAFPNGLSPFGLYDMCGNVWQWTESERSDGRTRFSILRGGSYYQRGGSVWYFDEGPKPTWFAAKMLLLWAGLDRCANIGFRCAVDL